LGAYFDPVSCQRSNRALPQMHYVHGAGSYYATPDKYSDAPTHILVCHLQSNQNIYVAGLICRIRRLRPNCGRPLKYWPDPIDALSENKFGDATLGKITKITVVATAGARTLS
jgi:hypothetical protein